MDEHELDSFEPIDVSEPQETRPEKEIIEEALRVRRREWLRTHKRPIFTVIGIIIVAVIVFLIQMYYHDINPVNRFSSSLSKDFGTSFRYTVSITENDTDKMRYEGTISCDRGKHLLDSVYQADYNDYAYTGAVTCQGARAYAGNFYQNRWTTHDCTEMAQNFFDFDNDFSRSSFDCGAFMRFTGLTSDFSIDETAKLVSVLKSRLSTDSALATIHSERTAEGEQFHYDVNLFQLFDLVRQQGASIFYRSADYDAFCVNFQNNKNVLERARCTIDYSINKSGYMTSLKIQITTQGETSYGLSCVMSDFGTAEVTLPAEFLKSAEAFVPVDQ